MNKKTQYWAIGIAAVVLIVVIWAGVAGSRKNKSTPPENTNPESEAVTGLNNGTDEDDIHAGMDHGSPSGQDTSTSSDAAAYIRDQDSIMAKMMTDMEDIPTTGSAAIDYLNGMIPHHESAVAMAESFLKHGGSDPELKKLAEDVIKVQTEEIKQMNEMITKLEAEDNGNSDMEAAYMEEYKKMFDAHHMSHMSTIAGSVDEAFADGMIIHHQMAADMSKVILEYTEEKEVKELAQNIIDVQEKEITQMQDILKRLQK